MDIASFDAKTFRTPFLRKPPAIDPQSQAH
jgi:hypothetical protein